MTNKAHALAGAIALGLAFATAPAVAAPPLPVAVAVADRPLDALVAALVPDDRMTEIAILAFDRQVEKGGDDTSSLFARHPGLRDRVADALRPEVARVTRKALPELRTRIRVILAAELSPQEIVDAGDFFASPTGQKVYGAALKSIGDNAGSGEADRSAAATRAVMQSLGADDYPVMLKFGASSASTKMKSINPRIAEASKAWALALVAKNEARMRRVARKATEKFLADEKRGKA
ncbi:DUF2059 domain-containing protein [Sphingomonas sp.]|uniref:DUF2059 domain-containing protein n=1 Tax=Sphingomonas sp. TaxID=28214 RepID=UPI001B181431|nr:DUF2059 domain-containing protein [Sphingomonas sp.]MBO9712432.1 DUF2059 domain-containing protein [Sphingomonas sp.]